MLANRQSQQHAGDHQTHHDAKHEAFKEMHVSSLAHGGNA